MGQVITTPLVLRKLRVNRQEVYAGPTLNWDVAQGNIMAAIVDQDVTINAPTNLVTGWTYHLELHIESYDAPAVTFDPIFGVFVNALYLVGGQVNHLTFVYNGSKLLMQSSVHYEFTVPWLATLATTPNIATDYEDWRWWQHTRIGQFAAHCPLERSTTYYVSTSGSDSNDGLSEAAPFATLAKAQTALAADVRIRFNRGDVWSEASGLTITTDNVTIDDYGDQTLDKPFFNRFVQDYSAATWTNAAGDRWTTAETETIRWVREKLDRLGETRGTHLIRVTSSAAVESTPNSWFWGSDVLHVNLDGDDPNSVDLEAVEQNAVSGIKLTAVDGCRIRNIRADGWGATGANGGYAFMSSVGGDDANLWEGLEGYVSGTHIMGHLASGGTGGKLMMLDCKAGYEIDPTGDGHYISYSQFGENETWCCYCEATYGAMKTSDWSYATVRNLGIAFAAHTTGDEIGMVVCHALHIKQGITGCAIATAIDQNDTSSVTSPANFANSRSFEVNTTMDTPAEARGFNFGNGRIKYGCQYHIRPYIAASTHATIHAAVSEAKRAYIVNCYVGIDFQDVPSSSRVLVWNREQSSVNAIESIHSFWDWINTEAHGDIVAGSDYNVYAAAISPGTGSSQTSRMVNSVWSADSATPIQRISLTNQATALINNALRNMDSSIGFENGHENGVGTVTLSTQPVFGTSNAQLLQAGSTNVLLSHDINGKRRTVATPDIGPVDFSS